MQIGVRGGRHWTMGNMLLLLQLLLLIHAAAAAAAAEQQTSAEMWHSPIRLANTMKKQKAK